MPLCFKAITIEPFAWVAANAFIGPGVTVHEGGVVGACSVVMRDTPAWTVVVGNPAKAVKKRNIARDK
jgi:putative colanic acid biosynthesis acetyltransferase WcaF